MKKVKLRRIEILKRAFNNLIAASFVRPVGMIESKLAESDLACLKETPETYIRYDELRGIRLQLLDLERQRAEAICLFYHRNYT